MAAPNSSAVICNIALDKLLQTNEQPVTNIESPTTETEKICARHYDFSRRKALRRKPWNFALKRAKLLQSTETPEFGFDYQYNLPVDFIRLANIFEDDDSLKEPEFPEPFEVEGGKILTNGDAGAVLRIRYVWDFTSVVKMDPLFIDLLAVMLAKDMAYKFTSSQSDVQRLDALEREALAAAGAIDGQERPPTRIERSRARSRRRQLGSNVRTDSRFI